ncbi:MAG TPA: ComEC/Rec2 family competence protein, partial [Planctomycetota bacterium]|nr:ComEC/Rec2 family competence protein [Planctomycetota bacterium]
ALLAALPAPRAALPDMRPGPVLVAGCVTDVVRAPLLDTTYVVLGDGVHSLRLQFAGDLEILPGDRLRTFARLGAATAPDLPGSLHGVAATVHVTPGPCSLQRLAGASRRVLERQLLRLVPGEHGAMLAALVLGRDTRTSGDLVAAHQATGLSHLLAVSGAHAAMLAFLLGFTGRGRGRRLAAGRARTIAVMSILFAYAAITGNEPPVLRAVVAFALAALACHLGRPFGLGTGLLAPAIATCLLQPEALLGPSFLLSYAAVCGLALAARRREGWVWRWLWGPIWASWWATLLTAPLTLFFFGQLAPWTVLLTPVLAPLVAFMLCVGLVTAMLGVLVPWLGQLLAVPLSVAADVYTAIVRAADSLPCTPVHAWVVPATWTLCLCALAGACVIVRWPHRGGVTVAAALLLVPWFLPFSGPRDARLQLFAVGHGQTCLVATASGHQTAIDCGSMQHPFLAAERLVQALRERHLDLLVVTHADQDHHNGVPALLRRVPIDEAILPGCMRDSALASLLVAHGTRVQLLAAGQRLEPAPHLRLAAPSLPDTASDNDQSLWVSVQIERTRVLVTGDAEEPGVAAAIAGGLAEPSDVLVLPHHGRPNAMVPALLQLVRPRACLASAVAADGDTVLGRIARRFGAELWVTGQHGTITLSGEPAQVRGSAGVRPLAPRRQ